MKRVLVLATALIALLATTASPAAASPASGNALSASLCVSQFSSLSKLGSSAATKALGREPALRAGPSDSEISGTGPKSSAFFTATVPVYFHVITDGTEGDVTDQQIRDQIAVMNGGYSGAYGGIDTGVLFVLAGVDRTVNAAWFTMNEFSDELAAKRALRRGGPTDLNIYTGTAAGNLGFAYFPKILVYQKNYAVLDGLVLHYGSLPGGFIPRFNLGLTAVHELGHWFGLYHTFERGCQADGDRIDDTPAMSEPTSGCPVGKDTCPFPGTDPIYNFMDYSDDACYREFTPDQSDRMQKQYLHWRLKRA